MPKKTGRRSARRGGWLRKQLRRRPRPAWVLAVTHVALLGIALLIYALPHHVLPSIEQGTGIVSSRNSMRADRASHGAATRSSDEAAAKAAALFADGEALDDEGAPFTGDDAASVQAPASHGLYDEGEPVFESDAYDDLADEPDDAVDSDEGEPVFEGDASDDLADESDEMIDYDEGEPVFGGDAYDDEEPGDSADLAAADALPDASAGDAAEADDAVGSFRSRFPDKFTDGEIITTQNSYQSANINVTFQKKYFEELRCRIYFVDIYVADISCLRTVLSKDTFGLGHREWITDVAKRTRSIATMNGDYYGSRRIGVVVRNGTLYRDSKNVRDVAVLYWDGTFETVSPEDFDARTAMENGAYQCWHFGPRLLDDEGRAMTTFNADAAIVKRQPRSAFGYFEPGHYCFIVVDGRQKTSLGITAANLSKVMEGLGCVAGYNLDGGQTSLLAKGTQLLNRPDEGGRSASDFIIVVDEIAD